MKPLKIIKDNNPSLRKESIDVSLPLSEEDSNIILNMFNYLKLTQDENYRKEYPSVREGVGLAAPQIGINKKMLVIYFKDDDKEITHALINPKIISSSVMLSYLRHGEGCLSVDNEHKGYVYRHYKIKVKAYDYFAKKEMIIVAKDYEAIILQHEIDHLSGILYYDRIDKNNPFLIKNGSIEI